METLNRNQNRSLNGKLNGNLNENLNGNLNGNPNGKLNGNWWKPDGNLNEPNLGPTSVLGGLWKVLGDPWVILGCSLEGPWRLNWRVLGGSLEGSLGDQTGTQGWTGTGPAPGTQKEPKVSSKTGPGTNYPAPRGDRFWDPLGDSLKYPTRTLSCTNC